MTRYHVFPDAEAIATHVIREADIEGVNGVYTSLPNNPDYAVVIAKSLPSRPAERHRLARARIQVEAWGNSKSEAHDIAQEARVALHEAEGQTFDVDDGAPVDAFITGVDDVLAPGWMPDPVTNKDRYIFIVHLYVHI